MYPTANTAAELAQRETAVSQAVRMLTDQAAELEVAVQEVSRRLVAVLCPRPETPPNIAGGPGRPSSCPLSEELTSISARLASTKRVISAILEGLEV